jgi:hypothetical protein
MVPEEDEEDASAAIKAQSATCAGAMPAFGLRPRAQLTRNGTLLACSLRPTIGFFCQFSKPRKLD